MYTNVVNLFVHIWQAIAFVIFVILFFLSNVHYVFSIVKLFNN
jgi:hypothetical protein